MAERQLHDLIFVGGHPGVGKTELSKVVSGMFYNVKVLEFRNLVRDETEKRGLKAFKLTTKQTQELMKAVQTNINEHRQKGPVVLLGHYVHNLKTEPRRKSDHVDVVRHQFVSYIRQLRPNALVYLDADTRDLLHRVQARKEEKGIGEWFLKKSTVPVVFRDPVTGPLQKKGKSEQEIAVERRRYAEFFEASALAKKRGINLEVIPVNTKFIHPAQQDLFWTIHNHGGDAYPLWKSAMAQKRKETAIERRKKKRKMSR